MRWNRSASAFLIFYVFTLCTRQEQQSTYILTRKKVLPAFFIFYISSTSSQQFQGKDDVYHKKILGKFFPSSSSPFRYQFCIFTSLNGLLTPSRESYLDECVQTHIDIHGWDGHYEISYFLIDIGNDVFMWCPEILCTWYCTPFSFSTWFTAFRCSARWTIHENDSFTETIARSRCFFPVKSIRGRNLKAKGMVYYEKTKNICTIELNVYFIQFSNAPHGLLPGIRRTEDGKAASCSNGMSLLHRNISSTLVSTKKIESCSCLVIATLIANLLKWKDPL